MATITLDLTGLKCPLPVLRTRKALHTMATGDHLIVRCTDPMTAIDIPHLVNETGHSLVDTVREGRTLTFEIAVLSI